jgi:HPr kinase/phosphorylase
MKFINKATLGLEMMFAPRGSEMGCMVDILGVGVIIRGESGIGKSEAVLALIERGYSLVADDIVKVTLVDGREVLCTSSQLTRDHMEVRGIGIINVAQMFGVKAIRKEKELDLIITLKQWDNVPDVDRLGMEQEFVKVLDVDIAHVTIPIRPGRDIARLIEVAAFQTKLRKSGYNAAQDLNNRLLAQMAEKTAPPPPAEL